MSSTSFDYAIVGAGAAGLNLALQFAEDPFFGDKKILILDKDEKVANDRTWSFWEKGSSSWDEIMRREWNRMAFCTAAEKVVIPLGEYRYKTIRSADFYRFAKEKIEKEARFEWIRDDVVSIKDTLIETTHTLYRATHVFDSRIAPAFGEEQAKYATLVQHFLGWIIETPSPVFNEGEVTIMDYRVKWDDQTSFHYILPFSPTTALVEFTLFNEFLLTEQQYEQKLKSYIQEVLGITDFTILEKEIGQIPMSNYPFHRHHQQHLTKIGTAGGWVRPSSGYSFKNAERYSKKIVRNLKSGKDPHKGVATNRFRFYDTIFLGVLKERNDLGEEIFHKLYTKQPIKTLFRFLDEQSTLLEDARIMFSLNKPIFRRALLKSLRS